MDNATVMRRRLHPDEPARADDWRDAVDVAVVRDLLAVRDGRVDRRHVADARRLPRLPEAEQRPNVARGEQRIGGDERDERALRDGAELGDSGRDRAARGVGGDEDGNQQLCLGCGAPSFIIRTGYCSDECLQRDNEALDDLAICGGCGRYGKYGKSCFRMLDGELEECGQFV